MASDFDWADALEAAEARAATTELRLNSRIRALDLELKMANERQLTAERDAKGRRIAWDDARDGINRVCHNYQSLMSVLEAHGLLKPENVLPDSPELAEARPGARKVRVG